MARSSKLFGGDSRKEQDAARREREQRDVDGADALLAARLEPVDAERARINKVQGEHKIVNFSDRADVKPLDAIRRSLRAGLQWIDDETDLIRSERWLASSSDKIQPDRKRDTKDRVARLKAKLKTDAAQPAPQPGELPAEIKVALDALVNRDAVKGQPKPDARLAELADLRVIVEDGCGAVEALIAQKRSEATYDVAAALQAAHGKLLLDLFRAAQRFAEAGTRERDLRSAFTDAGYSSRSDLLPAPSLIMGPLLQLGDEREWGSMISEFRRFLEARGLLK
jgi:hypothetical protein